MFKAIFRKLFGSGEAPLNAGDDNLIAAEASDGTGAAELSERDRDAAQLAVNRLKWLLDAPLFLDEALLTRMFDAIVRPEYEVQSRVVGEVSEETQNRLTSGEMEAGYGIGVPYLTGKIDAKVKLAHERERGSKSGHSSDVTEHRVNTPGRLLEELAAVYINSHPDRTVFITSDGKAQTFDRRELDLAALKAAAEASPRMLAFVDLGRKSKLMPMACELQTGETVRLFETYTKRLWPDEKERPVAPNANTAKPDEEWPRYWLALAEKFDSTVAMEIIEDAGKISSDGHGRIGWINFRVPLGTVGAAMHLHIMAEGKYPAGTFGYNFARRGFSNGVRLVGTLRSGLSLNVLAIFDT